MEEKNKKERVVKFLTYFDDNSSGLLREFETNADLINSLDACDFMKLEMRIYGLKALSDKMLVSIIQRKEQLTQYRIS